MEELKEGKEALVPLNDKTALPVSRSQKYKLIASGKLEAVSLGSRTYLKMSSIQRLIASLPPAGVRAA